MPSSRRKEIHNFVLSAIDPKIAAGFILHLQPHSSPNLKKFALGDGKGWDRWGEGSSEDISRTDRRKRFLPGVFKQTGLSQLFCKLPRKQIWELKGFLEGDEMLHFRGCHTYSSLTGQLHTAFNLQVQAEEGMCDCNLSRSDTLYPADSSSNIS